MADYYLCVYYILAQTITKTTCKSERITGILGHLRENAG